MKIFMKKLLVSSMLFIVSFSMTSTAYASTPTPDQYNIETYKPAIYTGAGTGIDPVAKTFNALADFVFMMTTVVYQMIDYAIELFTEQELIKEFALEVQKYSEQVFGVLFDSLGLTLFIVFVLAIFFTYLFRNTQTAIRQATSLFLVIGLTTAWFSHSAEYLIWLDDISEEISTALANIGNEGSTTDNLQQVAFEQIVYKPYLLMNYGTTDEDVINQSVPNRNVSLLFKYDHADSDELIAKEKEVEEYINENESENYYMSPENANQQLGIAIVAFTNAIILGIPIVFCSMLGFFLDILILLFSLLVPFCAILSLIPKFSGAFFNILMKIVMFFGGKVIVGCVMGAMLGVMRIVEKIIPADTGAEYLLQSVTILAIFIVVFVFRKQIISTMTNGNVTSVPGMDKIEKSAKGLGKDVAKSATKGVVVASGVDPATADVVVDTIADELEDDEAVERTSQTDSELSDVDFDSQVDNVVENPDTEEEESLEDSESDNELERTPQIDEEADGADSKELDEVIADEVAEELVSEELSEEPSEESGEAIVDEVTEGTEDLVSEESSEESDEAEESSEESDEAIVDEVTEGTEDLVSEESSEESDEVIVDEVTEEAEGLVLEEVTVESDELVAEETIEAFADLVPIDDIDDVSSVEQLPQEVDSEGILEDEVEPSSLQGLEEVSLDE